MAKTAPLCEICEAPEPRIVCLIPHKGTFAHTRACGYECLAIIRERYFDAFVRAQKQVRPAS
jgi:hypothetical protein